MDADICDGVESPNHIQGRCALSLMPPHGNRDCAMDVISPLRLVWGTRCVSSESTRAVWEILFATCISTNPTSLDMPAYHDHVSDKSLVFAMLADGSALCQVFRRVPDGDECASTRILLVPTAIKQHRFLSGRARHQQLPGASLGSRGYSTP